MNKTTGPAPAAPFTVAVIPVRAGSKGLPGKNVLPFCGRPLLAHSVAQAKASGVIDCVAVSSDSADYLAVGIAAGADRAILRPDDLATDTATTLDVLRHALRVIEAETGQTVARLVLLQATSPLRESAHIREALENFDASGADNLVSVCASKDSPYFNLVEPVADSASDGTFITLGKQLPAGVTRRQDAPPCYRINGSIYVWSRQALLEQPRVIGTRTAFSLMPELYSVDIDTAFDLEVALIAARRLGWPVDPANVTPATAFIEKI